jgi:hypothetical protein
LGPRPNFPAYESTLASCGSAGAGSMLLTLGMRAVEVGACLVLLVPKLQLGNPVLEAQASRVHAISQTGAWLTGVPKLELGNQLSRLNDTGG